MVFRTQDSHAPARYPSLEVCNGIVNITLSAPLKCCFIFFWDHVHDELRSKDTRNPFPFLVLKHSGGRGPGQKYRLKFPGRFPEMHATINQARAAKKRLSRLTAFQRQARAS